MILDTLLTNGVFYSMEEEGKTFETIGIKDGIIAFTGSNEDAKKISSKKIIDLKGNTVIPGMADAHMHMYAYCQNQALVDLQDARSIEDVVIKLKEKADVTPIGRWIKGVNFDQSKFIENRFPTKVDLDQITLDHPVVIKRCCLHAVVANSKALEMAGIKKGYNGGTGGIIEVDETGEPNGILREQSTKIFDELIPDPLGDEKEKNRIMMKTFADMSEKGITTIHTYAAKIWQYNEDIEDYRNFQKNNQLPLRVTVCLDELFEKEKLTESEQSNPYRLVQQGAYKLFTDGSLGSRSAALKEPYADDPENSGFTVCTQEELNDKVFIAHEKGLQLAIHAIGDAALDMTLTSIENCLAKSKQTNFMPFRIIHVQMIDEKLIERMKKLPLVLDIQPIFLRTDLHWVEDRLGPERIKNSYCWKTLLDEGFIQTGGSDSPVESYDPMLGIYSAVTRMDTTGFPKNGFYPQENLSVYEALSLYTKNVHYATGQQDLLGTLTLGKFADLVVIDKDIFKVKPEVILNIKVLQTYVAGKQVYSI